MLNDLLPARIASRIVPSELGCWEWTGCRGDSGYGVVRAGGKRWRVHRLVWTVVNGPIPDGLWVMRKHGNCGPTCCNPGHLFLGTVRDRRPFAHWPDE